MTSQTKHALTSSQKEELLSVLQTRFEKNMHRHPDVSWKQVVKELESKPKKLWLLNEMERTGGEPDIVVQEKNIDKFIFFDCSPESPKGRRSTCYDQEALEARKKHPPKKSAVSMAADMGIEILTEEQYRALQELEAFDTKTSSWIQTPPAIRKRGGALFCDRRYGTVFVYHNGADSYYAARVFRGVLEI